MRSLFRYLPLLLFVLGYLYLAINSIAQLNQWSQLLHMATDGPQRAFIRGQMNEHYMILAGGAILCAIVIRALTRRS
jgi:hypothetical protein